MSRTSTSTCPPLPIRPGHTAATTCLYIAVAILVIGHARGWWRWLFWQLAVFFLALLLLLVARLPMVKPGAGAEMPGGA